jgi:hypothetical protein
MNIKLSFILGLGLLSSLSGCISYGYVESDIPGVAQWIGTQKIESHTNQSCPNYGAGYGTYSETTTSLGLTRVRVEFEFECR